MSALLTQEQLKELVSYDKSTGDMLWIVQKSKRIKIGTKVGTIMNKGYYRVKIDGIPYLVHRLAWLYTFGVFPEYDIDHINGNRLDNRINNLREVTSQGNAQNRKLGSNNTSGVVGVRWSKFHSKWYAVINVNKKQKHLGYFENKEDAVSARKTAEIKYNYHENHGKVRINEEVA